MKKISVTFIFFLSMVFAVVRVHAQKVLLDDDFSTNRNSWVTYSGKQNFLIYNGKLIFANTDSSLYLIPMPIALDDSKNFSVSFSTTHTDGVDNHAYGLYFGSSDLNNYYVFYIAANGFYKLAKIVNNQRNDIVDWTQTTAIKTGNYVENVLQLSKQGANWIVGINNQTLRTVPAPAFIGNKLGFTLDNVQRVEFDNVKVTQE